MAIAVVFLSSSICFRVVGSSFSCCGAFVFVLWSLRLHVLGLHFRVFGSSFVYF